VICVFDKNNTTFTGNGDAVLIPTEAKVKMVAGGNYDMTMTHPIDPYGKWQHLVPGAVIRVPVPEEEIANAWAGYDVDIYKTTAETALREGPEAPTTITYSSWSMSALYSIGDKVTYGGKNYRCTYFDGTSRQVTVPPPASDWWKEIPRTTSGAAALVTLPAGSELYFVENYNTDWYKMSTYYGIVGYIEKSSVTFYRHQSASEVQPRIITTQLLRITNATVDTKNNTVSVTAQHVSYDLNGVIVQEVAISQASPAMAIGKVTEAFMIDYPGTIATNLDATNHGTYTETIKGKTGMYCLMDPDKGIASQFEAEFRRDNWDLFIMEKTDTDRGFKIKYRKNQLGVSWARKSDSLVTRVVPVAKDEGGADLYLPEKWIDSTLISNYPIIRMEMLSVKGQVGKDKGTGDQSTWTEADLLTEMRTKAGERFSVDKADQIQQEITVDFEMLGATAEYADLRGLEKVLLYDVVTVEDSEIGLNAQLTVTEMEWDPIRQKITAIKISNVSDKGGKNVTGYNVVNKSIGAAKLSDDVAGEIVNQVVDIIPEFSDQTGDSGSRLNTVDYAGFVAAGGGNANKVWKTDGDGNPAWREEGGGIDVIDNLTSSSTTDALSAKQGRVLNETKLNGKKITLTNGSEVTFTLPSSSTVFMVVVSRSGVSSTSAEGVYIGGGGSNNSHVTAIGTAASNLQISMTGNTLKMTAGTSNMIANVMWAE